MIERATREQVPALRMLWESVFGEDPAFLDLFFARVSLWAVSTRVGSLEQERPSRAGYIAA